MKKAEFDEFAIDYAAMHEKSLGAFGQEKDYFAEYKICDVASEVVRRGRLTSTRRILDFGSGCGNSVPYFRKLFPQAQLTCIDVSAESLEIGRRAHPGQARFLAFNGHKIPAESGTFDTVFSACVFHHIDHAEHASNLAELHRVLEHDGLLLIFEHNPLNPLTVRIVNQCPFDINARLIRASQLRKRVVDAGFEDVAIRYRLFIPPALRRLMFIERYLIWLPLGAQYYVVARKPRS